MTTTLLILAAMAVADVLIFGAALVVVGWQYRRMRREALVMGEVLPPATGQFVFVGAMLALGAIAMAVSILGLISTW